MNPDRFISYGMLYAGLLFGVTALLATRPTADWRAGYFLALGGIFAAGGLYRLLRSDPQSGIPERHETVVVYGTGVLLAVLTLSTAFGVYATLT